MCSARQMEMSMPNPLVPGGRLKTVDILRGMYGRQWNEEARLRGEAERLQHERLAMASSQQSEMQRLQGEASAQAAAQRAQAAELQSQQAQRLAQISAAGQAVTSSLQILGNQASSQGPTAAVMKQKTVPAGTKAPATSLRIGAAQSGVGSGFNLPL